MPDDEINLLDELDIGDGDTDFGRGYARGVIEGRREAAAIDQPTGPGATATKCKRDDGWDGWDDDELTD